MNAGAEWNSENGKGKESRLRFLYDELRLNKNEIDYNRHQLSAVMLG